MKYYLQVGDLLKHLTQVNMENRCQNSWGNCETKLVLYNSYVENANYCGNDRYGKKQH